MDTWGCTWRAGAVAARCDADLRRRLRHPSQIGLVLAAGAAESIRAADACQRRSPPCARSSPRSCRLDRDASQFGSGRDAPTIIPNIWRVKPGACAVGCSQAAGETLKLPPAAPLGRVNGSWRPPVMVIFASAATGWPASPGARRVTPDRPSPAAPGTLAAARRAIAGPGPPPPRLHRSIRCTSCA